MNEHNQEQRKSGSEGDFGEDRKREPEIFLRTRRNFDKPCKIV